MFLESCLFFINIVKLEMVKLYYFETSGFVKSPILEIPELFVYEKLRNIEFLFKDPPTVFVMEMDF